MLRPILLAAVALTSVVADVSYLPPGQDSGAFNSQYLPPGGRQAGPGGNGGPFFGQRGAPLSRYSDVSPPSLQYGNVINPSSRGGNRNQPQFTPSSGPQRDHHQGRPSTGHRQGGPSVGRQQADPSGGYRQNGGGQHSPAGQYGSPNQHGAPNTLAHNGGNANLGSGHYNAPRGRGNGNGGPSQFAAPSGPANGYSTLSGIHNTPPPPSARHGGSSYAAPSDRYGSAHPTQYQIPLPHADSGRNGAGARGYAAPESAPAQRHGPAQRGGSRYAAPAGYDSSRTPYDAPAPVYGVSADGLQDDMSEPANYEFMYEVQDDESGNDFGHMETRQDDDTEGTYYVVLPDGRKQIVEYKASPDGYKPMIRYEGTANGGYGNGQNDEGPY